MKYFTKLVFVHLGEDPYFEKDLQVEAFDSTTLVIIGGMDPNTNSLPEVHFKTKKCFLSHLPKGNHYSQSLVLTSGDFKLLNCGGFDSDVCYQYNMKIDKWQRHSVLSNKRAGAVGITMPKGVYIFGGTNSPSTVDFLGRSLNYWTPLEDSMPVDFQWGCGVKISPTELVLIGGFPAYRSVRIFNTDTEEFTPMTNLAHGRFGHSCVLFNDNIIVAGGKMSDGKHMGPTEIISLKTYSARVSKGNLNYGRMWFGMHVVGGRFPRVLAVGGSGQKAGFGGLDSIEEWNDEKEEWTIIPISLEKSRSSFGSLALPESIIC